MLESKNPSKFIITSWNAGPRSLANTCKNSVNTDNIKPEDRFTLWAIIFLFINELYVK